MDHKGLLHTSKGLRPIRAKLHAFLEQRGWATDGITDIWLSTMPSFVGYSGINPLTVYYIYKQVQLWIVILEVHNTFGEKYAYVLETGVNEDAERTPGFDHQWTFPRQFHVSPFNDRSGYYRCFINAIPSPSTLGEGLPRPIVKLHLITATEPPQVKLMAITRASESLPLNSRNLVACLAKAPLALLLTLPRITYEAFFLHYQKRLDIYPRPEPVALLGEVEKHLGDANNPISKGIGGIGGGIGWQKESLLERWTRRHFETFLSRRARHMGITIRLVSSRDSDVDYRIFGKPQIGDMEVTPDLTIYYRSSTFFAIMILAPSPQHGALLAFETERVATASSLHMFIRVFTRSGEEPIHSLVDRALLSCVDFIRRQLLPPEGRTRDAIPSASRNALDEKISLTSLIMVVLLYLSIKLEKVIFLMTKTRFVEGSEPWNSWRRLSTPAKSSDIGSITRE
ncbi:hypothetical protein FRC03_003024 [Tulasnella sp. 419]|nr:hypothetical protein FRC03_003024 [Tulasnella sp. 419]